MKNKPLPAFGVESDDSDTQITGARNHGSAPLLRRREPVDEREQEGDPLERLAAVIPWESFRTLLARVHEKERKSNAGPQPLDGVLMFKVLILQSLYNLSDNQVEYQIRDRLSFARFLGLGMEDEVPDATTVWRFRERLEELGLMESWFDFRLLTSNRKKIC